MPDGFVIQSHKGPYSITFMPDFSAAFSRVRAGTPHFIVDKNVSGLYRTKLSGIFDEPNTIEIEATEENKAIQRVIPVIEQLVEHRVRRDHVLVAIGGGIIQDITCYIASTLLRGLSWRFVPTTLLAQADSCIGSKSSINLGAIKNILGTFNPPNEVIVCPAFIDTLEQKDVQSGIGEILKVHAIEGAPAFDRVAKDYDALLADRAILLEYVRDSLLIKQRYIEADEFDRNIRNVFNYGHSFGHAIESVTDFGVPHGVAVTMGMDMANRIAVMRGICPEYHQRRMSGVLQRNYAAYKNVGIEAKKLVAALMRDKKNTASKLVLILPTGDKAEIKRTEVAPDSTFEAQCARAIGDMQR